MDDMGAELCIKSKEAHDLASRLAELTGQSVTEAVIAALRDSVAEMEKAREAEAMIRDVRALAAEIRAELAASGQPLDLSSDFLYDEETGLPV